MNQQSQSPPPLLIDLALIFIERPTTSQDLARSGGGVVSGLGSDEVDAGSIDKSFRRQPSSSRGNVASLWITFQVWLQL